MKDKKVEAVAAPRVIRDKELAEFRLQLLDLGINTATKIPVDPHIKDRSKVQEDVVVECLRLGLTETALMYSEKIENYRRGSTLADVAQVYAREGFTPEAETFIQQADEIARNEKDWRRDHVLGKIAGVHALLGQDEKAEALEAGIDPEQAGKVARAETLAGEEASFEELTANLDELIAKDVFELTKTALQSYTVLFDQHFKNSERRDLAEEKIKTAWRPMPIFIRLELLEAMTRAALRNEDQSKALELANEAQAIVDGHEWIMEERVPRTAKVIELRYLAGDTEAALAAAAALLDLYHERRTEIVNIWRAGALRPLAEAYQAMGQSARALEVYKLAVEEGMENPNARPRAEDLSATCVSMARVGLEPDEELWTRMNQIYEGLDDPW